MGSRLPEVIGPERVEQLISLVYKNNDFFTLRNNAIYWNTSQFGNKFPNDYIDKKLAQEILLFAIEAFDDSLVVDLSQYLGHILVETVKPFFLLLILQIPVGLDSESSYGFDFGYKILQCS